MWVETGTEGGRRYMAAWRKEEVDVAKRDQKKRGTVSLENWHRTLTHRTCEATSIGPVDEPKESCSDETDRDLSSA